MIELLTLPLAELNSRKLKENVILITSTGIYIILVTLAKCK